MVFLLDPFGLLRFNMDTLLNLPGVQHPTLAASNVGSLCLGSDHTLSCPMLGHPPYLYRLSPHPGHPTQTPTSLCLDSNTHRVIPCLVILSNLLRLRNFTLGSLSHLAWSCVRTSV